LATGGSDGALMFWMTGQDQPVGEQETAHESNIWSLDWHPVGHILVSGSNDHTTRFWTRPRPGELTSDKFDSSQHHDEEPAPVKNEDYDRQQFTEPPPFRPHNIQGAHNKIEPPPFRPANMPRPPSIMDNNGPPPFRPNSNNFSNNFSNDAPPPFRPPPQDGNMMGGMMRQNQPLPPQQMQHMQHQQQQQQHQQFDGGYRPQQGNRGNPRQFGRGGMQQQQQRHNNNDRNMQHQQGYRPPPPMMNNNNSGGRFNDFQQQQQQQQQPPRMMNNNMNNNLNKRPISQQQDNLPGYRPPPPFSGSGGGPQQYQQHHQTQQFQQSRDSNKKPRRWN
jgi:polyadenylation factor subunit 2